MIDYLNYQLYNLTIEEKKSFLTFGMNNNLIKKYNSPSFTKYLDNNKLFHQKFSHFLNYDYLYLNNFIGFKTFIQHNPIILANNQSIKITNKNYLKIYQKLIDNKISYLTSNYEICPEFKALNPEGNVFIRFLILKNTIINAYLFIRFQNNEIYAPINLETGIVDYPAINNKFKVFDKSPITKESIIWFKIPRWPRIKRYVEKISDSIPEINYLTLDITLTTNEPILLNGSSKPMYTYYQQTLHRQDNYGIMNTINKIRKEEIK